MLQIQARGQLPPHTHTHKKNAKKQNRATVTKYLPKDRLRGQKVIKHFISHMERATQGYQDTSVLQVIVVKTPTQIS